MIEELCSLLKQSIKALGNPAASQTLQQWRGNGDLLEFAQKYPTLASQQTVASEPNCIVIAEFARWALSKEAPQTLIPKVTGATEPITPIDFLIGELEVALAIPPDNPLFHALIHAVLATVKWCKPLGFTPITMKPGTKVPSPRREAYAHLARSAKIFDENWGLTTIRIGQSPKEPRDPETAGEDLSRSDRAAEILRLALECGTFGLAGLQVSTYLTLHRLLRRILRLDEPLLVDNRIPIPFSNSLQVLFASPSKGVVRPVQFEMIAAPYAGAFLDPIEFGVTQFDSKMKQSIQIAWQISRQIDLNPIQTGRGIATLYRAIRIGMEVPFALRNLQGPSAGPFFAAGMIATMQGLPLDSDRCATCAFEIPEGYLSDDTKLLQATDIVFRNVGSVPAKLDAAWYSRDGIDEVFLSPDDAKAWNDKYPNWKDLPKVTPVTSLHQLVTELTSESRFDRLIKRHTVAVFEAWDRIRDQSANEDSMELDRDHRFDCYVPPILLVEGERLPKKQENDKGEQELEREIVFERATHVIPGNPFETRDNENEQQDDSQEEHDSADRTTIPTLEEPESDQQLVALLNLMLNGKKWPGAPDWLHPFRRIVLYDVAGAGKTVCTHRVRRVLTDPKHIVPLFGPGAQPIVIRIEGRWPRLLKEDRPATIRELLVREICREGNIEASDLLNQAIDYSLKKRRVVIVLDGFDQFTEKDQDHVVKTFSERSDDDDHNQCHLIIASRVHSIDEYFSRGQFFGDKQWTRVRIEPFNRRQQDAYFHRPKAATRIIGDAWLKMIADREAMHEFLGLPMFLKMLRVLCEDSINRNRPLPVFYNLSQLYLVTTRRLLERVLTKNREHVESQTKLEYKNPHGPTFIQALDILEHVLCTIAFQMMLMEEWDGRIETQARVDRLFELCRKRYLHDLTEKRNNSTLRSDQDDASKLRNHAKVIWAWAIEFLRTNELKHRSVAEQNSTQGIAFRSRKMMECHAARYLTRYATDWDIFADRDPNDLLVVNRKSRKQDLSKLCAWNYTTHQDWKQTWQLAIDMPLEPISHSEDGVITGAVINHEVTCRSLSALFELPKAYEGRGMRPTELIHRCWHLFELDIPLLRERWFPAVSRGKSNNATATSKLVRGSDLETELGLEALQSEGRRLLLGENTDSDAQDMRIQILRKYRSSASNVPVDTVRWRLSFRSSGPGSLHQRMLDNRCEDSILQDISKQRDIQSRITFLNNFVKIEGGTFKIASYHPGFLPSELSIATFELADFPITNEVFEVFCPGHDSGLSSYQHGQPCVNVNWFMATEFCHWLTNIDGRNYRLPTEWEWEWACRWRGTLTDEYWWGPEMRKDLCHVACPNALKNVISKPSTRSRVDAISQYSLASRHPSAEVSKGYGLLDMAGNVMEWCQNSGDYFSFTHAVRGGYVGAWDYECASSYRRAFDPDHRSNYLGFRVCRV